MKKREVKKGDGYGFQTCIICPFCCIIMTIIGQGNLSFAERKVFSMEGKGMKEKMRKILVKLGRKCRPLAYPVFFVMVFFVSVYHTCRRVFLNMGRQKFYRMVCGSAAAAALVLALFVWPTMAPGRRSMAHAAHG